MATLRCPVLVGREAEITALSAALDDARGGSGSALVVLGQPGIGKSRLVGEVVDAARSRAPALPVLVGRAVGDGQAGAFRPLVEALLAGLRTRTVDDAELGPFRAALGRLLPQFSAVAGPADVSLVVLGEAVLRLLRVLSAGSGLLMVLEDLHWSDPDTLSVVEYLADNISTESVLILLTARSGTGWDRSVIDRLAGRGAVQLVELNPLHDADVTRVVTACLGEKADLRLLPLIQSRAEGVPLLIEELLTLTGTDPSTTLVPASVATLTRARLDALPTAAQRCLHASAVIGERFDWTLLPTTTGLDENAVLEGLRAAIEADLLAVDPSSGTEFMFRHALTRDAVLDVLLPPQRSALARRALNAVHTTHPELDGQWCDLAANLASLAGENTRAGSMLIEMGRRDLRQGALATAETALQRAITLTSDPLLTANATEVLAEVFVLAGKPQQAADVTALQIAALVELDAAPSRLAQAHLRLARAWTVAGQWDAASQQLEQGRALTGSINQLGPQADLVDALIASGRKDYDHAAQLAQTALAATENTGSVEVMCEALEILGRLARRTNRTTAETFFERARIIAEKHNLPLWHVRALHELSALDLLDSMRLDRIDQAREAALQLGALAVATDSDYHRTAIHVLRGELESGLRIAERSTLEARRLHLPSAPATLLFQGGIQAMRGETLAAEALITEALTFGADNPRLTSDAWNIRGISWLLAEDRQRALDAFDQSMEFLRQEQDPIAPPIGQWGLLATLERGDEAIQELTAMPGIRVARQNDGQLSYAEAVQLGRRGDRLGAHLAFTKADITMTTPVPIPFYRHISRRLVAEAAIRDGWGDPAQWLPEDLAYFQAAGHDRVAAACRGLLRRAGARVPRRTPGPPVPDALRLIGVTGREMDVLNLISDGLSNREIATRLFLSPRTVEKHTENLLTKTGLPIRSELIAKAARDKW